MRWYSHIKCTHICENLISFLFFICILFFKFIVIHKINKKSVTFLALFAVAPLVGAWVEMSFIPSMTKDTTVAPLVGARAKYDEAVVPSGDHHWHGGSGGIFDI